MKPRLFPAKFSNKESNYSKSISVGQINQNIILFDSHGDIVDISSSIRDWKMKRIIRKLRLILN